MVGRQVWGTVALAFALAGCSNFVDAQSGTDGGDASGSRGSTGSTDPTLSPSTSGMTDSATSGTTTTTATSNAETDPTTATNTDPTESDTTDPVSSSTTGNGSETTDPSDGTAGPGTDTTGEESTGPGGCIQLDDEDNDSVEDRQFLDDQVCEEDPTTFTGTLLDESDLDRFQFDSPWTQRECGTGEPDHVYVPNGPIELCASPGCDSGMGSFFCEEGTMTDVDGFDYCCSTGPVRLDITCTGFDESSTGRLLIRADQSAPVCAPYTFSYAVQFDN